MLNLNNAKIAILIALLMFISQGNLLADTSPLFGEWKPGPYGVGYKFVQTYDYSRTFNIPKYSFEGEFQEGERARPMNISIWFPAKTGGAAEYQNYEEYYFPPLPAGQQRTEQQISNARQGIKNSPLAQTMDEETFNKLMSAKTAVLKNAVAAEGSFPLIIFAQGGGQPANSQTIFCEYLASHGFIVATLPSQGVTGPINFDLVNVEAQARDVEFLIGYMREFPHLDKDKLGIAAFSMGGMAAAIVAMRNSDVDAVLSLDSAIGTGGGFSILFQSPNYNASAVKAGVLHIMVEGQGNTNLNYLENLKYTDVHIVKVKNLGHFDFSSWGMLAHAYPNFAPFAGGGEGDPKPGYAAIGLYALHFLNGYVKKDETARAFLKNPPATNGFSAELLATESRIPENRLPSESDIVNLINSGRVDRVVELYREYREKDPDLVLFDENVMNNLGYQLMRQQRLDEAIEVFKLNVEAYPDSWNVYDSLGEGYGNAGNVELAIEYYSKALEMAPENQQQRINGILENFKSTTKKAVSN